MATNGEECDQESAAALAEALQSFKRRCSERGLRHFEVTRSSEVKIDLLRIQRDQERLRAMMNLRRVEKFVLRLEDFSAILQDIFHGAHYLSIVWGAMHFLLQTASSTLNEGLDSLLDAYEGLGKNMPSLKNLNPLFTKHTEGRKKVFKSAWKDFNHTVSTLKASLHTQKTLIENGSRLLNHRRDTASNGKGDILTSEDIWNLSSKVADYEKENFTKHDEAQKAEEKRRANQFQAVLRWVCPVPKASEDTHHDRCAVRGKYPETCNWIMKHDAVHNWMEVETPTHSILWVTGGMGAGKSTLASFLVDACMDYPNASTCVAVFQSLLRQQLMHIREDPRFRHLIAYLHDKKDASGQQNLSTEDAARPLLDLFFDVIPHQYIIIDGLDECDKAEIRQCLSLLTHVVSRQDNIEPGGLRLLVLSRDIQHIEKPLSGENCTANILRIRSKDNEAAIEKYVMQRVGEFPQRLELSKDEKEKIKHLTCNEAKGAKGMFLFAELVLNNLQQVVDRISLTRELEVRRFPKTLREAYGRIIDNLRQQQDEYRWEKTKSIMGWLICAGRVLQWHEIQAIVSIERDEQSVEFNRKKFIPDVQDFCGSLVHIRPGNKVELIHHTASEYILDSQFVSKVEVEFDLALLCMQYLTFPCFERSITRPTRKNFAKEGFYAFQDYAVSKWFYHIAQVVRMSRDVFSVDKGKAERFTKILDDFIHRFHESIEDDEVSQEDTSGSSLSIRTNPKEIEEHAKAECKDVEEATFHPILLHLWIHISRHQKKNIEERNKPSLEEMEEMLSENRNVIEELVANATGDEASDLTEYYGKNVFKCPRTHCDYFYEGFEDVNKRDHHINRHDRPFECTVPGCQIGGAGFISNKDLDRHKKNYHMGVSDEPAAFPQLSNKKKSNEARFPCEICGQRFTRKINLTGHTRSHFGERPYGCQNCGKKFTRVNDLRRHEKLHLRK
ncbi:hypothetical protein JX266_004739 [Neoarthrinium moseri]|nr:hypothetical protein JX266_004739 [Neoarthrinium moseri]